MKDVVVVVELKKVIGHERCSGSGGVEVAMKDGQLFMHVLPCISTARQV